MLEVLTLARENAILPEHAVVIRDPSNPADLEEALLDLADRDADTILFYFAGHGLLDDVGDLYLATTQSSNHRRRLRSLPYEVVRRTLADAQAKNRLVLLDCCYSGRAISAMGGTVCGGDVEVAGSYTLTSTSATKTAHAPAGETYTAFTGALLDLLWNGEPDGPELLDMMTVYRGVTRRLRTAGRPKPEQQNTETVLELALGINRAGERTNVAPPSEGTRDRSDPLGAGHPDHISTMPASPPALPPPIEVRGLEAGGTVLGVCFEPGTIGAVVTSTSTTGRRFEITSYSDSSRTRNPVDRARLARIHVVSWTQPDDERLDHPPLPLPHAAATFSSILPAAGAGKDSATIISVGAWHQVGLRDGSLSGPSRASTAKRLANSNLYYLLHNRTIHWDLTGDGDPAWLVTSGFLPDMKDVGRQLTRSLLPMLIPGRVNAVLKGSGGLSVYDAQTYDLRGRVPLEVRHEDVLHLQTLPGRRAAMVVSTNDKRRPLRRLIIDLRELSLVTDDYVAADPIRRPLFAGIGAPDFQLSADGGHIAVSSARNGRTVIYAVDGRGAASNVPGVHVAWSPTTPRIAVCDNMTLTVLNADARSDVVTMELPFPVTAAPVFSPDGTSIAIAGGERVIVVSPLSS
ncbi:caspase family protein [Actinoplanes sp. GCM10030250]|uniref:caspase, EACC1-associated type n=1 Tax=Actinoplanes sp. GCM10030250 TaxID=3273376 RepID=UPI00360EF276